MSQAYASNAESVKDYLKNYTDEQINTMGDMVSNENNMALQEWRDKAEKLRSAKELGLEESGEILGGIVGVKGIGKGISKVKDIYKKGQKVKSDAEELAKKARESVQKGKDATEKIKKDLEEKTKGKNQKSKEDNDPENDAGDIDDDPDAFYTTPVDADAEAAEQEGSKEVDDGEGDTTDAPEGESGGDTADASAEGGEADSAIDFDNLEDVSTDTLRNFFSSRIGAGRDAIKQARERFKQNSKPENDSGDPPSTEQEGAEAPTADAAEGAEDAVAEAGNVSGVDLDSIFSQDLGGTEEGLKTLGSGVSRVVAKVGGRFTQRIGDGPVEDVLSRPTKTTLNANDAPTKETDLGGNPEEDIDPPASVGGETEMNVYKNTAPTSYVEEGRTFQSSSSSAYKAAEGKDLTADSLEQGGTTPLKSTIQRADKTLDIDTPQPDAAAPAPEDVPLETFSSETGLGSGVETTSAEFLTDIMGGAGSGAKGLTSIASSLGALFENKNAPSGNPQADDEDSERPKPEDDDAPLQDDVDDIGDQAGSLNEYASKVASNWASRGANIRGKISSAYNTIKKKVIEEPEESGGDGGKGDDDEGEDGAEDDLAETTAETGAEEGGLGIVGDVALGALGPIGEAVGIGYALYSGIEDLFGGSSSPPPPKTKVLGTTLAGGNPLDLGGGGMQNLLSSGISTTESVQDQAGSLSF